jgi:hypothetical protein
MEIEFNPSRVPRVEPNQIAARANASASADQTSFPGSVALQDRLKNISDVRPEKVAAAQSLVADTKYPPGDVLDRIAVLLAINLKP